MAKRDATPFPRTLCYAKPNHRATYSKKHCLSQTMQLTKKLNKEINHFVSFANSFYQALRSKGQGAKRRRVRRDPQDQSNHYYCVAIHFKAADFSLNVTYPHFCFALACWFARYTKAWISDFNKLIYFQLYKKEMPFNSL